MMEHGCYLYCTRQDENTPYALRDLLSFNRSHYNICTFCRYLAIADFVDCLRVKSKMRGYVLSQVGLEKVENFISVENKLSRRQISLESCLDRATVTKALQGEKPVNLRTIRTLFLSLGIPLEKIDYCRVTSINRRIMGQNKQDYDMLIKAAEKLEEAADKEHDETKKQELLDQAQELRVRAFHLPDDDE